LLNLGLPLDAGSESPPRARSTRRLTSTRMRAGVDPSPIAIRGFRYWAVSQGSAIAICGIILSWGLIYQGFIYSKDDVPGALGILLLAGLVLLIPRVLRGGEVAFDANSVVIRTAWAPTRRIPRSEIVGFDQHVSASMLLVFTCPRITRSGRRRILLNDFHAFGLTELRATHSPSVTQALSDLKTAFASSAEISPSESS
jgi:hypothetical protein